MNRYTRITLLNGKKITLRYDANDDAPGARGRFFRGVEVDKYGDEVQRNGADEQLHYIELTAIKRFVPMVLDPFYAELVREK